MRGQDEFDPQTGNRCIKTLAFRKFNRQGRLIRNLMLLFGEALPLQSSPAETIGLPRGPRRLSRLLRTQFRNQRTATIGPDLIPEQMRRRSRFRARRRTGNRRPGCS